jgi:hypothetical protein
MNMYDTLKFYVFATKIRERGNILIKSDSIEIFKKGLKRFCLKKTYDFWMNGAFVFGPFIIYLSLNGRLVLLVKLWTVKLDIYLSFNFRHVDDCWFSMLILMFYITMLYSALECNI